MKRELTTKTHAHNTKQNHECRAPGSCVFVVSVFAVENELTLAVNGLRFAGRYGSSENDLHVIIPTKLFIFPLAKKEQSRLSRSGCFQATVRDLTLCVFS